MTQPVVTPARPNYRRGIDVVPRKDFLRGFRRDYGNGQHLTQIGPTQRGKTTLGLDMLEQVVSPQRPTTILSGKPPFRDATMNKAADRLHLRVTEEWPPNPALRPSERERKNGYVLRPHQTMTDVGKDEANMREQFRKGMVAAYASKSPVILMVDEAHLIQNDLGLKREYEAPLMRGAPDCAVWSNIQRGRYISYLAYDMAEHLTLFYDPDLSNVRRYAEMIGGVDPSFVAAVVTQLKLYRVRSGGTISEALYIKRSGPELFIVDVR